MGTQVYTCLDGKRVPSVTTVIGRFKDSGALMRWQSTKTRELDVEAVQRYWKGSDGHPLMQGACAAIMSAPGPYDAARDAATAGTICHQWIEDTAFQRPLTPYTTTPGELLSLATKGLKAFNEWWASHGFTPEASETPLVSEKYRFGGTIDLIARDNKGRLCILDWKCTNGGPYADQKYQLGAYKELARENGHDVGPCHLLRVSKNDGSFHHHSWPAASMAKFWEQFIAYRACYDRDREVGKL